MTDSEEAPTCAFCGEEVSRRGTTGADGKRYCSYKRSCQRARNRDRRGGLEVEARPCFHCGKKLPERPRRVTDSMVGRWCRDKRACMNSRRETLEAVEVESKVMEGFAILECPACHLPDARFSFPHWTPAGEQCAGPDGEWLSEITMRAAMVTWPEQAKKAGFGS